MAVKPGDILRDKYRIDAMIGRGGMGHVYAATALDSSTRAQVAIKVVSRLLVDDVLMVRLHREAEAAQRIQSDYVPRVVEVSDTEDGETFLVMERLVGEPLSQRIRDNGALPWSEVAKIGEDVLRGLIDAHGAGIVHRDLKPSNVFLALKSGRVRAMVLDFGVCKMDGLDAERLTGTGESIGTVAYMAPEQIRGAARVDERADLYAFGVLVFEMLSGRLPHEGPSQMAILASKLENTSARLRDCTRVAIPEPLDELVARTLERDPTRRQASAQELLKEWRNILRATGDLRATPPAGRRNANPLEDGLTHGQDPPTEISRPAPLIHQADSGSTATAVLVTTPHGGGPNPNESLTDTDEDLASAARARDTAGSRLFIPPLTVDELQKHEHQQQELQALLNRPGSGSFPPEPHPTQTSLTTNHGSTGIRHGKSGARLALILAACGLVAGVVVVGVSITRNSNGSSSSSSSHSTTTGAADPSSASTGAPTATIPPLDPSLEPGNTVTPGDAPPDEASFELPTDPQQTPNMSGAPAKPRMTRSTRPRVPPVSTPKASATPKITNQPRY